MIILLLMLSLLLISSFILFITVSKGEHHRGFLTGQQIVGANGVPLGVFALTLYLGTVWDVVPCGSPALDQPALCF